MIDDGDVRILHGDAVEQLRTLEAGSVQMIASSPPFWGLRDYGTGEWEGGRDDCNHAKAAQPRPDNGPHNVFKETRGDQPSRGDVRYASYGGTCPKCGAVRVDSQIGLEETPDAWVERLVEVFRECRRVLRDDGVLFVEIGDSYASGQGAGVDTGQTTHARAETKGTVQGFVPNAWGGGSIAPVRHPAKPKDLVGQPWLLAFALRADGWYLRSEIIWHRPNPMPESVTDRPTKAHSTVFLLTKRARYYYDADAIREPAANNPNAGGRQRAAARGEVAPADYMTDESDVGRRERLNGSALPVMANARTVWTIATEPTPFAHFATWPQTLAERMVKCGTSEHGACTACGAPWRRLVVRESLERWNLPRDDPRYRPARYDAGKRAGIYDGGNNGQRFTAATMTGWGPTCECNGVFEQQTDADGDPITVYVPTIPLAEHPRRPCVVLDPFMGSGTTALVARRLGRHAIGVELNADYIRIARDRLAQLSLFAPPAPEGP